MSECPPSQELSTDHTCEDGCSIDWMLDPKGPADPEWLARIRADLQTDRWVHRWKERQAS